MKKILWTMIILSLTALNLNTTSANFLGFNTPVKCYITNLNTWEKIEELDTNYCYQEDTESDYTEEYFEEFDENITIEDLYIKDEEENSDENDLYIKD